MWGGSAAPDRLGRSTVVRGWVAVRSRGELRKDSLELRKASLELRKVTSELSKVSLERPAAEVCVCAGLG